MLDALVAALDGRKEGNSFRCHCPLHDGHHLIVTPKNGDRPLVKCMQDAPQADLIASLVKLGLWTSDGLTPSTRQLETEYRYLNLEGQPIAIKGRFQSPEGKTFAWRRPGVAEWTGLAGLKESGIPLYGTELLASDPEGVVWLVEGEKTAETARQHGLLALSVCGGASQKDFGKSLHVLAGRQVILWPDNDEAGRLLMRRIAAGLEGLAASVKTIAPDLPAKGDAHDYFSGDGKAEALLSQLTNGRTEPWAERLEEGWNIYLPFESGVIRWSFTEIEHRNRGLEAETTVEVSVPGLAVGKYGYSLNLNSTSTCDSFRRGLDDRFPGLKGSWSRLMNEARQLLRDGISQADPSVLLDDAPDAAEDIYLIENLVMAAGSTIFFGQGGSGKTMLILSLAIQLARRGLKILFVDYEATAGTIKRRVLKLGGQGLPIYYWAGAGTPLVDQITGLKQKVDRDAIDLIIVDSAAMACGADPERPESATTIHNALARLKIPAIIIAHVTKANEDQYPFGSIFWSNCARLTWNVKKTQEEGDPVAHVGLFNRKPPSEDRKLRPVAYRITFGETIAIESEDPALEFGQNLSLTSRIRHLLLRLGRRSLKEIAEELDAKPNSIDQALRRMSDVRTSERAADGSNIWEMVAESDSRILSE